MPEDDNSKTGTKPGENGGVSDPPVTSPNTEKKTETEPNKDEPKVQLSQAELSRMIADARDSGRKAEENKRAKQLQEQEAADKVKQGEFEALYNSTKPKLEAAEAEVVGLNEQLTFLAEKLNDSIDLETKPWPSSLKKLDPGKDKPKERLEWVNNSRDLASDLLKLNTPPNGEHGKGNRVQPTGKSVDVTDNYIRNAYRRQAPPSK